MASPSPVPGRSSVPQAITFGDDGSAGADAAWRWLTAQAWPGWTVDVIRARPTAGEAAPVSAGGRAPRVMPRRCEAVRVRTLTTPLAPAAALLEHSGTGVVVIGAGRVERDRSGGRQALLTTLVADGHRPVLVAREGRAMRSALVVADGSVQAEAAARVLASCGRYSMSPRPSSFSAPAESRIVRESMCELTANEIRVGMFALIRPVITSTDGRWVATTR